MRVQGVSRTVVALVALAAALPGAALAYINGPPVVFGAVTAGRLCAALAQAGVSPGAQREGHTLASVSCSGGPSVFNVRVVIR